MDISAKADLPAPAREESGGSGPHELQSKRRKREVKPMALKAYLKRKEAVPL